MVVFDLLVVCGSVALQKCYQIDLHEYLQHEDHTLFLKRQKNTKFGVLTECFYMSRNSIMSKRARKDIPGEL